MRNRRFHGLKRIKLRQSWNKYNLFNLSRAEIPYTFNRTFFQQKWTAKALTRAYHGETIREKHWKRMFRRSIRAVVPMNPWDLAQTDGSKFALGRGSGLEEDLSEPRNPFPQTPYLNMVYAPVERRLDTAVFRAMFASSTRQARQFVVHGSVKVNGKKMVYPAYQLNPGDMFQVEPERVLWATGAPKDPKERRVSRRIKRKGTSTTTTTKDPSPTADSPSTPTESSSPPSSDPESSQDRKDRLESLLSTAKSILSNSSALRAKRKQNIRQFLRVLRTALVRPNDTVDAQVAQLTAHLGLETDPSASTPTGTGTSTGTDTQPAFNPKTAAAVALSKPDAGMLRAALAAARENPIDDTKPYSTPWRPRDWMSAFAFIPRYLEVHHRICSAVYLRHPVARPGMAEVPTPYGDETNGLAFLWYLRRR